MSHSPASSPSRPPCLVRLAGVGWGFAEGGSFHPVLQGVDLELREGELVVLLGRSGSGKSTLLNLVGGLERPTAGSLRADSVELADLPETRRTLYRRRRVGFVFQFFNLVPTLTVLENLLLPLELNDRLDRRGRRRAEELLAEVGLGDRLGSFPDVLSGGEQQRVAVARALIHDPPLVLADEPTGNLDLETGREVLALLDRLTRRAGKTLLMATHSREVAAIADRVFTLRAGRLIETGLDGGGSGEGGSGEGRLGEDRLGEPRQGDQGSTARDLGATGPEAP